MFTVGLTSLKLSAFEPSIDVSDEDDELWSANLDPLDLSYWAHKIFDKNLNNTSLQTNVALMNSNSSSLKIFNQEENNKPLLCKDEIDPDENLFVIRP